MRMLGMAVPKSVLLDLVRGPRISVGGCVS